MSLMEEIGDAPMSISGEMWMCADSTGPSKVGAGRGLKNFITIEKDRFIAYTSRSAQSKQVKLIAFRSMKRVAWYTHHPKVPGAEATGTAAAAAAQMRRRVGKDPLTATYYYIVLEFLRDNTVLGTVAQGKRERVVLCTDDQRDFSIWRQFIDLYESPPIHDGVVEGRDKKALKAQPPTGGAPDHDDTTSSDDSDGDGEGRRGPVGAVGRRVLDLWRNRCVALLNDFAHLSDASLQVKSADVFEAPPGCSGGLDWDVHAEAVLHAVERDMRPSMKVVPPSVAGSTDAGAAGPSPPLDQSPSPSPPRSAPRHAGEAASATDTLEMRLDAMRSQASHLRVELEQFQAVAAEVGAMVEGRELSPAQMSPDALHGYVERLRAVSPPVDVARAADAAELECACAEAVREFTSRVRANTLAFAEESSREQAIHQERAALPQRVRTVVAVLLDELTRATADVTALRATLAERNTSTAPATATTAASATLELHELRKALNRAEMELEGMQQQQFDAGRHAKHLSRRYEELLIAYADAAQDMVRSQYREYASLHRFFLSALRGEASASETTSTSAAAAAATTGAAGAGDGRHAALPHARGAGAQRLVVSTAHFEAIQALEEERRAAREKQQALDEVMTELAALRQDRDEEIENLKRNFLAAKAAWEKDEAVLQVKLAALRSAVPRGAVILPATATAAAAGAAPLDGAPEAEIAAKLLSTAAPTRSPTDAVASGADAAAAAQQSSADGLEALHKVATLLCATSAEASLDAAVAAQRQQAFYDWALHAVVPLTATTTTDGSFLQMVTAVVHAHHAVLQQTAHLHTTTAAPAPATPVDLVTLIQNEHELCTTLWDMIDTHLLESPAAEDDPTTESDDTHLGRLRSSYSSPPALAELDLLCATLHTVADDARHYRHLLHRCGAVSLSQHLDHLDSRSAQLDIELAARRHLEDALHTMQQETMDLHRSNEQLRHDTATALSSLGIDAASPESAGALVARAAADAAERERALRADVAAAEERVRELQQRLDATEQAAQAEQEELRADHDERLRTADEQLAETDAARQALSDGVAGALAALGVDAASPESAGALVARAAADAAERERALRADVAAAEERVRELQQRLDATEQAAQAEQEELRADHDERLRTADEQLAETDAARQALSDGVAGALAALGVDAASPESAGALVARAAADAAERERALRADVAAAEERVRELQQRLDATEQAAQAEQEELRADHDERLRVVETRADGGERERSMLQLSAEESEARVRLVLDGVLQSVIWNMAGRDVAVLTTAASTLGVAVSDVQWAVEERLAELRRVNAALSEVRREGAWYRDAALMAAVESLEEVVPDGSRGSASEMGDDAAAAQERVIRCMCRAAQVVRSLVSEGMVQAAAHESLSAVVAESSVGVREAAAALREVVSGTPGGEAEDERQRRPAGASLDGGLRVACRGMTSATAECVAWAQDVTNSLSATYQTLASACQGEDGAAVGDGRPQDTAMAMAVVGQLPRLATQVCAELAQLRRCASLESEVSSVTQQRSALLRSVGAHCGSLHATLSESGSDVPALTSSIASPSTVEEADALLRGTVSRASGVLRDYARAVHRASSALSFVADDVGGSAPPMGGLDALVALTAAARDRVVELEGIEQQQRQQQRRETTEAARERDDFAVAAAALQQRCDAVEAAQRGAGEELATLHASATLLRQRADTVARVFCQFANDISTATGSAELHLDPAELDTPDLVALARQLLAPADRDAASHVMEDRLAAIVDACRRGSAELTRAQSASARVAQEADEVRAVMATYAQRLEQAQAQVQEGRDTIAILEAALEKERRSAVQAQHEAARAHEVAIHDARLHSAALESRAVEAEDTLMRVRTELTAAQECAAEVQGRLDRAEEGSAARAADVRACLAAVGRVASLEEVAQVAAAYRLEYKKKSLEAKEARRRRDVVQEWAASASPTALELHHLRAVVAGISRVLPGTALVSLAGCVSQLRRDLSEAERLLGAPVSTPCTDGASREVLLEAVEAAGRRVAGAAGSRTPGRWGAAPRLLVDAVHAVVEERDEWRASASDAAGASEQCRSAVVAVTDKLRTALSAAAATALLLKMRVSVFWRRSTAS
ncbi:hypothetical protein NESM_000314200 [Novymonas esmeraldas]|uniref:Uncharacterized protein n=1 Tax=Novymonas esmeraldas TaxID=1808958 RepID=A0AAW0EIQ2_9TRYP